MYELKNLLEAKLNKNFTLDDINMLMGKFDVDTDKQMDEEELAQMIDTIEKTNTLDILHEIVVAPMMGPLWMKKKLNDTVNKGEVLCTIESMKLLHEVVAPYAGTITNIFIKKEGEHVHLNTWILQLTK